MFVVYDRPQAASTQLEYLNSQFANSDSMGTRPLKNPPSWFNRYPLYRPLELPTCTFYLFFVNFHRIHCDLTILRNLIGLVANLVSVLSWYIHGDGSQKVILPTNHRADDFCHRGHGGSARKLTHTVYRFDFFNNAPSARYL